MDQSPARPSAALQRTFGDLPRLVDHGQTFLDEVENMSVPGAWKRAIAHTRLVVHEWLANLMQYGDFGGRTPRVAIKVLHRDDGIQIAIDDNSAGFDLEAGVRKQRDALSFLPSRGMGLLMIAACTEGLGYVQISPFCHRLTFCVPADVEPALEVAFSEADVRPSDPMRRGVLAIAR